MKIRDFYDDTVTVPVEHRGRTFSVEAYPERNTSALSDAAMKVAEADGVAKGQWHVASVTLKSWTLEDELNEASFLSMSPGLRLAIIQAVGRESSFPTTAASAENSSTTSAQAADTEGSPAGTPSPTT
jgi:hypothetical protein